MRIIGPVPGADVLVLAGDIADGAYTCTLFADCPTEKRVPIILIAGNHEFYGHPIDPIYDRLREGATLNIIHFLENDSVVIDGVRFMGTKLWTDYRLQTVETNEGTTLTGLTEITPAQKSLFESTRFSWRLFS